MANLKDEKNKVVGKKLTTEEWIVEAKRMLKQYKDEGGVVADLGTHDDVYGFIKKRDLFIDGKRVTLEEKFAFLGEPRARKNADDVEKELRKDIERFLANGGSFHIKRKGLPFYERLHTFARAHKLSIEETMKSLGYKNYSNIYYRFLGLQDISKYCDENGYFIYKREMDNAAFHNVLEAAAETLQMPASLVVLLLCDKKMESCVVEADYVEYLKTQLEKFAKENDGFIGIKRKAPELYEKLRNFKRHCFNDFDDEITTETALAFMGLDDFKFRYLDIPNAGYDISNEMKMLAKNSHGKIISRNDLSPSLQNKVYVNACRQGTTIKEYLGQYGIQYKGLDTDERFNHIKLSKYPYIDEMKQRRDELIKGVCKGKDLCKEEIFEQRVLACKQAYSEFKDRINSFTGEKIDSTGKNMAE